MTPDPQGLPGWLPGLGPNLDLILGLSLSLCLIFLILWLGARRREGRLHQTMLEADDKAREATRREQARAERERFSRELTLALQGSGDLEAFGTTLLEGLCRHLEARAAVFHYRDEDGNYRLGASYARNASPAFIDRYAPGEGLAGQAVLDRQRRLCQGEAADGVWVSGATLASAAVNVIIAPLVRGEQVPGVVELALLREADADALALLDGALPAAALSLDILLTQLRAQRALAERDRQLRASETRLRRLFETANEGIWTIDTSARTTDLNQAMAEILGRPREEVLGRTIFEFVDATNEAIFHDQVRRRQQGETGAYEIALSRPDGTQVPCLFNATPLLDDQGNRIGSFAMVADLRRFRQPAA